MGITDETPLVEPLDGHVDHVRGQARDAVILEYGDYECPYSRQAFRAIERVEWELSSRVRFAFRHFPLTQIHPHALAAAASAEAAGRQGRFWEMHSLLFDRQQALEDEGLRTYAGAIGLDIERFDLDRANPAVMARITRDVATGEASRLVRGTPTLFINSVLHEDGYDTATLLEAVTR